jgi:hypothetical protein
MAAKGQQFTVVPFTLRLVCSALLVFATYNPSGYSYYHWAIGSGGDPPALKIMVGLALALLYAGVLRVIIAAFRRSGLIVGTLAGILFSIELVIILLPHDVSLTWRGWVLIAQYTVLGTLTLTIAFGISWSSMIERLTGQQQKRYVR